MEKTEKISKQSLMEIPDMLLEEPYIFWIENEKGQKKEFRLKPPSLAKMMKISKLLLTIDIDEILNTKTSVFEIYNKYGKVMLEVLYNLLQGKDEFNEETKKFISDNLTAPELYELILQGVSSMGIGHFRKSIIAVQAMSLLNNREMIARLSTLTN